MKTKIAFLLLFIFLIIPSVFAGNADTNISTVDASDDALPLMFSQTVDGNLTVRFYVYDSTVEDVAFSMWYDTTQNGTS